jgi:hypothetical protein
MPRTRTTWTKEQTPEMAARSVAKRAARAALRKLTRKAPTAIPFPPNGSDLDHTRAAMCARIEAGCSAPVAERLSRAIRNITPELNGGRANARPRPILWSAPIRTAGVSANPPVGPVGIQSLQPSGGSVGATTLGECKHVAPSIVQHAIDSAAMSSDQSKEQQTGVPCPGPGWTWDFIPGGRYKAWVKRNR